MSFREPASGCLQIDYAPSRRQGRYYLNGLYQGGTLLAHARTDYQWALLTLSKHDPLARVLVQKSIRYSDARSALWILGGIALFGGVVAIPGIPLALGRLDSEQGLDPIGGGVGIPLIVLGTAMWALASDAGNKAGSIFQHAIEVYNANATTCDPRELIRNQLSEP